MNGRSLVVVLSLMLVISLVAIAPAIEGQGGGGGESSATTQSARKELVIPKMTEGKPAPGKFVKQTAPEYKGTEVHHALYLPADWVEGKQYPVIVEYAGNRYMPICSGKVKDCKLGFYQSGGNGFIWIVLPYVSPDGKKNQMQWWGDLKATLDYCKVNVPRICRQYGGDTSAVFVTGFSRGAIACGYLGLYDDEIADLWAGFLPHSHHDGGHFTKKGALERLARVKGRPSFITWGENDGGKKNSLIGKGILEGLKSPVKGVEIPKIKHSDLWITKDSPERRVMRKWLADVIKTKPGTHAIGGKVTDSAGKGVGGVCIQSGAGHWTFTNPQGRYLLRGLVSGKRTVTAAKEGFTFAPARTEVMLDKKDLADVNFKAGAKREAK